jgi:hypothetical protein
MLNGYCALNFFQSPLIPTQLDNPFAFQNGAVFWVSWVRSRLRSEFYSTSRVGAGFFLNMLPDELIAFASGAF